MRTRYHQELAELGTSLTQLCDLSATLIGHATRALLDADLELAEQVISDYGRVTALSAAAEERAISLLALQQPVAGDLRSIVSCIRCIGDVERMGALAVHVAKIVRERHPEHVLPAGFEGEFAEMGRIAVELAGNAKTVVGSGDPEKAAGLREQDDVMDGMHRRLFAALLDRGWKHGAGAAVDLALLGRFYERFADHAVEIGRRVVFETTGTLPPEQEVGTY
ncbi:Phosphate-specific transport system accessory protein PhoU [Mycolicibacterium vanbaalenii]|uniref:Phosphate-specific transport system accessory protein PhoU n=1 Tax=Mycolicibacterium vanbaalenii TaxID=110539 RepID=A0A5S9R7A5_MYCVN|nr:phosphate signaling complex protein PhoU [Mycolicibacterium vanbaalenii]CAA0134309.1 Phosphate-specific transport system accessory protein PhoU [Mycolicibacterium vanbaalenii]